MDITQILFSGHGAITFSNNNLVPPPGSPVTVSGRIDFGNAPLPERFTGTIELGNFNDGQSFRYEIAGGGIGEIARPPFYPPYYGGSVTLLRGRLVSVQLYVDNDGDLSDLYPKAWRGVAGIYADTGPVEWGGKWSLVPEPAAWAMLITGFGIVGAMMRRRRALLH